MTSWVITIDKDHPQHWGIAKQHRFWDMTKHLPIELGDTIYFWQAGDSMVAQMPRHCVGPCDQQWGPYALARRRTTNVSGRRGPSGPVRAAEEPPQME